ncbi:parapinopsin [Rothia dentocariosa]|uniref:parapinopsin n=2 Tax=Rothia dentocariosa TaxID=2047 RepID=UPI00128D807D|nr:parapinopsin [Rothia dentocariosa]
MYWGWGPFWALWAQVLIWWPVVGLVVRVAPSHPMTGPNLPFYVVLFSLPFIGIVVNFCLFLFLRADIAIGIFLPVAFLLTFLFILFPMPIRELGMYMLGSVVYGLYPGILLNNYYELYRVAKMSDEELEEYKLKVEEELKRIEESNKKDELTLIGLIVIGIFMVSFFSLAIPAVHWKGYDASPMLLPTAILVLSGLSLSVIITLVFKHRLSGWFILIVLVAGAGVIYAVWGYPVWLLIFPFVVSLSFGGTMFSAFVRWYHRVVREKMRFRITRILR